jgi:Transposase DDE domain
MFFRSKRRGQRTYLQVVENFWQDGRSRQRVLVTLGRLDLLQQRGQLDALLTSGARFAEKVVLLTAHRHGQLPSVRVRRLGPVLVFERLWHLSGCLAVLQNLLAARRFAFDVERAVFLTVLHRLLAPGSDRAADKWKADYPLVGAEDLHLHHLYRAMAWLGEELDDQRAATPFAPRCTKDVIEEALYQRRRDLFTSLEVVFFDTTSLYFEGEGGETLGCYGHSKDHRPDLMQMIVGAVLDGEGRPICCELWPGNVTDVKTLMPILDRLRRRFGILRVCIVADRGMMSAETVQDLEEQGWPYILGARMRKQTEVREQVLADGGRFRVVHPKRRRPDDPAPLKVKEVCIEGRRYVVCVNEDEVKKDQADREAIVAALHEQLRQGDKSLVGNKGYRRYLKVEGAGHFVVDEAKLAEEARYDGTWVLRTNTELSAAEVALQYKRLWQVEQWFRSCKSLVETRPIYHRCDATIRGHVFCSFLALLVRYELQARLAARGHVFEWADVLQDLERLQQVEVEQAGKRFRLRSEVQGTCARVFRAVGVAIPPTVQELLEEAAPSATRPLC